MRIGQVGDNAENIFLRHSPGAPLSACVGVDDVSGNPLRLVFEEASQTNVMIVGRSPEAALGMCTTMLLDLASQIVTTPDRAKIYTTPPFSILDYLGTSEAGVFTDAAMALPLPTKLERATDTEMTTLKDFQHELVSRGRRTESDRHPKFMFLCGLQAAHGVRDRGFYRPDVNPHATKFARILHEGPAYSLHVIVWCNSFANIELTMTDGLAPFRHVIVLGESDQSPFAKVDRGSRNQSWYVDQGQDSVVPMTPFGLPSGAWCEEVVGAFGN